MNWMVSRLLTAGLILGPCSMGLALDFDKEINKKERVSVQIIPRILDKNYRPNNSNEKNSKLAQVKVQLIKKKK